MTYRDRQTNWRTVEVTAAPRFARPIRTTESVKLVFQIVYVFVLILRYFNIKKNFKFLRNSPQHVKNVTKDCNTEDEMVLHIKFLWNYVQYSHSVDEFGSSCAKVVECIHRSVMPFCISVASTFNANKWVTSALAWTGLVSIWRIRRSRDDRWVKLRPVLFSPTRLLTHKTNLYIITHPCLLL